MIKIAGTAACTLRARSGPYAQNLPLPLGASAGRCLYDGTSSSCTSSTGYLTKAGLDFTHVSRKFEIANDAEPDICNRGTHGEHRLAPGNPRGDLFIFHAELHALFLPFSSGDQVLKTFFIFVVPITAW